MFQAVRPRLSLAPSCACDIIIPVFNRPDRVRDLLESLTQYTDRTLLGHIWIGDDGSDVVTQKNLAKLVRASGLPASIIHREKNMGFAANCNDLFSHCTSKHVVVLNTDVRVPAFWLERMLEAFASDERVVLATPYATNAANHTLRLQPGQSWTDADRLLAARTPTFPDDCTAIGFCMAVDREALIHAKIPLFDPAFGRGYGEDTDLHYRVLQAGFRSVIVDHLLVFHAGTASFSALPDHALLRDSGQALFWKKWADVHTQEHARFEASGVLSEVMDQTTHTCRFRSPRRRLDVLFILPSSFIRYGGVWFACTLVEHVNARGYAAAMYVQNKENLYSDLSPFGFRPYEDLEDLIDSVSAVGCVVATSDETIGTSRDIAQQFSCPQALFLQCMEVCFRSGISIDTYREYKNVDRVITVSQALTEYIKLFHANADAQTLPIGPDSLVFYPRDVKRVPKTVAIAVNQIPEKGFTHALEVALLLKDRGFSLTFFGWDTAHVFIPEDIGTVMKETSRTALADLFSRTEFLIDHSYIEGLALLPLEAAFCGCVPILASKGAPEYIFEDGRDCIRLTGYTTLGQTLERIASLDPVALEALRNNALRLRDRFTLQKGCAELEKVLQAWGIEKTQMTDDRASYALTPRQERT